MLSIAAGTRIKMDTVKRELMCSRVIFRTVRLAIIIAILPRDRTKVLRRGRAREPSGNDDDSSRSVN